MQSQSRSSNLVAGQSTFPRDMDQVSMVAVGVARVVRPRHALGTELGLAKRDGECGGCGLARDLAEEESVAGG